MSNIEDDVKIVKRYLENSSYKESDSDFFKNGGWEMVDLEIPKSMANILSEREQDKARIKELEEKNVSKQKAYDEYKHYKQFDSIPKQKVKDKIKEIKEDKKSKYYYMFLESRDMEKTINILEELLEGEE